ncbi:sorbitol dehydrogenase [Desulfuromonas versatilis]|uniref:Sorbitol dehydrogenase n=1 Tax=Desulfuromonas versatilis TaxID=2802975 RepID=A0ABM8HVI4_9BACT|nr:alcohol dehydrogenase catalytic domain-containing protein [Desulfuromonas versatilis]BCR06323.1 sorbitol dehydrogenase [Desulfuromonas versatilis]
MTLPIPDTMAVAMVHDFADIRIEQRPVPAIGPREILVKVAACGVCSGDVMDWYIRAKAPLVLGHEPAGTVVQVGKEVKDFAPGDRVFMHHHAPCFVCERCRRGLYSLCPTWKKSQLDPGGMAEYVRVAEVNLADTLKLPEGVSFAGGTLVEPAACAVKGIRKSGLLPGETVLVTGLGVMGMLNILVARAYGAARIIAADLVPWRLQKALELGADAVVDVSRDNLAEKVAELTGGGKAERVIVGPGTPRAMAEGIRACAPGGTVLLFTPTPPGQILELEPHFLYFNEITLACSYSCGPYDTREALELIARGAIRPEQLVTHRFPLQRAGEAFATTVKGGESLKSLVVLEEGA